MMKTPAINLQVPLITNLPPNNADLQAYVIDKIRSAMDAAKSPVIIVDGGKIMRPTAILLTRLVTNSAKIQELLEIAF